MTSRLLNEAELFFAVTLRRLYRSSSRGRSYSNLTEGAEGRSEAVGHMTAEEGGDGPHRGSPLVVLGVLVSLLHCRFLFGGLVFVWQQREGHVAVHGVLALGQKSSVQDNARQYGRFSPCF